LLKRHHELKQAFLFIDVKIFMYLFFLVQCKVEYERLVHLYFCKGYR
jgi:hypothetical protein